MLMDLLTITGSTLAYLAVGFVSGSWWARKIQLEDNWSAREEASMILWLSIFFWPVMLPWKAANVLVNRQLDKNDQDLKKAEAAKLERRRFELEYDIRRLERELKIGQS